MGICLTLSNNEKYKPETRSLASGPESSSVCFLPSVLKKKKKNRMNGKACTKMIFGKDDGVLK